MNNISTPHSNWLYGLIIHEYCPDDRHSSKKSAASDALPPIIVDGPSDSIMLSIPKERGPSDSFMLSAPKKPTTNSDLEEDFCHIPSTNQQK